MCIGGIVDILDKECYIWSCQAGERHYSHLKIYVCTKEDMQIFGAKKRGW